MNHPVFTRVLPALLLALAAAGCGTTKHASLTSTTPGTVGYGGAPTGGYPAPYTGANPGGGYTTMPAPGVPGQAGSPLAAFQAAWANLRTLSGHYDFWEKNGSDTEIAKVDLWFQKPGHYRLEVSDATDALKRGSKSVFDTRTRQISSRPGGPLSLVKIDGTLDDARSKSVRGYTLDQTDYASQVNVMLAGGAQVRVVNGRGPGPTLELANPAKFPGIDALRETLDPQKMLPVYFEMSSHGQVVHTRRYTSLNVNPSISSDKFSI